MAATIGQVGTGNIDTTVTGRDKAGLAFTAVPYVRSIFLRLDATRQLAKITNRANFDMDYDISQASTITVTINTDRTFSVVIA
jgi:hypothetical protein